MPKPARIPSYRLHKPSSQAVVVLDGRSYYLGKWESPESRVEYRRVVAEWLARDRASPAPSGAAAPTVDELILRYWQFAERHYSREGVPSRELDNVRDA